MASFDIRKYMWNIFEIYRTQDIDNVRLALDMFIANMELGYDRYDGASDVDYSKLHDVWDDMSEAEHVHEKLIFNKVLTKVYLQLCDAWRAKDRRKFDSLCMVDLSMFGIPSTNPLNKKVPKKKK